MPPQTKTRRRGAATRERIIAAATTLFSRDGYLTTTMGNIAAEAGVAVQTLYLAYGSKVGILSAAHDVAIVGDEDPVPLLERDWVQQLSDTASVTAGWEHTLEQLWRSTARVAPIYTAIASAAADPDVAELNATLRQQRHRFSQAIAELLLDLPGAPDADVGRVADVLYATLSAETYTLLVTECGWPVEQWRQWVHDVVVLELIAH
ncbi:MAG TPA: TetR/AcrR family transcriptional regulator [Jiangellaceae bacterium]|nr:TetR/AcrR family transcriptional regulator [Jiangellaceae bacterium]